MLFFAGVAIGWLLAGALWIFFGFPLLLAVVLGAVGGTALILATMLACQVLTDFGGISAHEDNGAHKRELFRE